MIDLSSIQHRLQSLNPVDRKKLAESALNVFNSWPLGQIPTNWQDIWQEHLTHLKLISGIYNDQR